MLPRTIASRSSAVAGRTCIISTLYNDAHRGIHLVSDPEEDFAAMFAASQQARQFEKGQTIEGTIVAIGPEVAFVDVGGKGEAVVDLDELKDADGVVEVA